MTIKKFFGSTGVGQVLGGLVGSVPIVGGAVQQALAGGSSLPQVQTKSVAALPSTPGAAAPSSAATGKTYIQLSGTTYKRVWMIALASAAVIAFGPALVSKFKR